MDHKQVVFSTKYSDDSQLFTIWHIGVTKITQNFFTVTAKYKYFSLFCVCYFKNYKC